MTFEREAVVDICIAGTVLGLGTSFVTIYEMLEALEEQKYDKVDVLGTISIITSIAPPSALAYRIVSPFEEKDSSSE